MPDEEPKTAYESAKQAANKLFVYRSVMQQVQQGKFIPNLNEIAAQAAAEMEDEILKEDAKANIESSNRNQLYDYIQGAASKFSIRAQNLFEKKLEDIINETPTEALPGIERRVFLFAPKEHVSDHYKELAKLHRQIARFNNTLAKYQNANPDERKDLRDDVMFVDVREYYEELLRNGKDPEKAKENAALLNASLKWTKSNADLCEAKYRWLLGRRRDEFNAKLLGISYKEYKKLKDAEKDEAEAEAKEIEKELEGEEDESVKRQHMLERMREHSRKEYLPDKIRKKLPDYMKEVMGPESLMNAYLNYWQEEAMRKAQEAH